MSINGKFLGAHAELQCITYIHGLGYDISIPWGDNARYDFIIDIQHKLYKVQCKKSRQTNDGVYSFNCCSTYSNTKGSKIVKYTEEDIDFFCTYINNKCYLIPLSETNNKEKVMRFAKAKMGQVKNVVYAERYLAENQIEKLLSEN